MDCATTHDHLLDYVYEACEDDVKSAVAEHLATCPACTEAHATAQGQQGILSEAAAVEGPALTLRRPDSRRSGGTRSRVRSRVWLSVAAGLLVLLGGSWGYRALRRAEVAAGLYALRVDAPSVLPATGSARLNVATLDVHGGPVAAEVQAEVLDAQGAVLGVATVLAGELGASTVEVPADLGAPGEYVAVQISATFADGGQRRYLTPLALRDHRRLLARVGTDKPIYRPGETLRARFVALDAFELTPAGDVPMRVRLLDPHGAVAQEMVVPSKAGVSAISLQLPGSAVGGEWIVECSHAESAFPTVERTVLVRTFQTPRLRPDLTLDRDSYGPGQSGHAWLSVQRAEGGVPAGAQCEAVLTVDGEAVSRTTHTLSPSGTVSVPFSLPVEIREGRALIALTVIDGGVVETATKTVPVSLDRLQVECFPEGGELVAGLPNRLYFRVRDPLGEPAHAKLEILDGDAPVASGVVETRGMGVLELTPRAGATYRLRAIEPADVQLQGTVPAVAAQGATLRALHTSYQAPQAIEVEVAATEAGTYQLEAVCRGRVVGTGTVDLSAGGSATAQILRIPEHAHLGGVVRVTLFDPNGVPLAERLVSVSPEHRIALSITPESERVSPGERVTVQILARDQQGRPAKVVTGVTVANQSTLDYAADDDTASFPMHFLLGLEVDELESVELFATAPGAARAVDRLLGVQGWRRFAWRNVETFLEENPELGPRVVAAPSPGERFTIDTSAQIQTVAADGYRRVDRELKSAATTTLTILGILGLIALIGWALAVANQSAKTPAQQLARTVLGVGCLGVVVMVFIAISIPGLMRSRIGIPGERAELKKARVGAERGLRNVAMDMPLAAEDPFEEEIVAAQVQVADPAAAADAPVVLNVFRDDMPGTFRLTLAAAPGADGKAAWQEGWGKNQWRFVRVENGANVLDGREGLVLQGQLVGRPVNAGWLRYGEVAGPLLEALTREYAHHATKGGDGQRRDFTDVLYWNPLLETDAEGRAVIAFDTSDAIAAFRVEVEAHDGRGALAVQATHIENRLPFYMEPKLPVALSAGDEVQLPVAVVNDTADPASVSTSLHLSGLATLHGGAERTLDMAAGGRARVLYGLTAKAGQGELALQLTGSGPAGHSDAVEHRIPVQPRGYPMELSDGGQLEGRATTEVLLPGELAPGSLRGSLRLYPNVLSTLVDGLEGMLQMPGGCFEQASSSNYPNVLVLSYLAEGDNIQPAIATRARSHLDHGYGLLTGYECTAKGYEWFGSDPGHEALTAYGLVEFVDMAKVHDVDAAMIDRTRAWLLSRRDGKGGYQRDPKALDSFGRASPEVTDAYITWAITESSPTVDLKPELDRLEELCKTSRDPYLLALSASALANAGRPAAATVRRTLVELQEPDGSFPGAQTSITSSGGKNLLVETTAFGALALLRADETRDQAELAITWLATQRTGSGRFGSTQATIMALRALVAHARASKHTAVDHDLVVRVNGGVVAERHVPAGTPGVVAFDAELVEALRSGRNRIEVTTSAGETLPWALGVTYHTLQPPTHPDCAVRIATELADVAIREGATVRCTVTVDNVTDAKIPMTLARVGLPAGLTPRVEQLKELKEQGLVGLYETRPREVTLYWRGLEAGASRTIHLDLVAEIPGTFEGPASSAYLYYTDDQQAWTAPMTVTIAPR